MNIFIVYAHAEPKSSNGALFQTAQDTLRASGRTRATSDLYAMRFDPVSDRRNFTTVRNRDFSRQQIEEMHATEVDGFAPDVEAELRRMEACVLIIRQFPLWWFGLPGILKGWVDHVLAMGRTYGGERFCESGAFKGNARCSRLPRAAPIQRMPKAAGTATSTAFCARFNADAAIHLADGKEHVAEQHRKDFQQRGGSRVVGHLQLQHPDGDEDGDARPGRREARRRNGTMTKQQLLSHETTPFPYGMLCQA